MSKAPKLLQPKKKKVILVMKKNEKAVLTPDKRAKILKMKRALA